MDDSRAFETISFAAQTFLRSCFGDDTGQHKLEDLLAALAIFGPDAHHTFSFYNARLLAAVNHPTTISPWKHAPERAISGATAHEVAGILMTIVYREIFAEKPKLSDPTNWIARNKSKLQKRLAKLETATDYSELLKLAAAIEIERSWVVLPSSAGDGEPPKTFQTSGEYFEYLHRCQEMSDARIRDLWQGKTDAERKAICSDEWLKLETRKTTRAGAPSATALARQVKSLRQTAEKKLAKDRAD